MKKWKCPTWKDLIYHVNSNINLSPYIQRAPKRLRPALGAALAVAKWHPARQANRGMGECGLCILYYEIHGHTFSERCSKCPLYIKSNESCCVHRSLFQRALMQRQGKATERLYALLCEIYAEEWEKL